ncbi:MAG: hypothetical protein HUJ97_00480 [Bacteroidales bacterium]|nr:hypothetical protein [Bacteroidales bacterium]
MIPILLTATVNPQGMVGANFNPDERADMYVEALRFYLNQGCNVVFAENSGSVSFVSEKIGSYANGEVEFLDVSGDEYDQSRGKGYNETILLHKAVVSSSLIKEAGCFFKVTGRLKVLNILVLLKECESRDKNLRFLGDCKDHNVYEWLHMPINGHAGECRYWFAKKEFFESQMWPRCNELNDYEPRKCLAEDLMLDVCRKNRGTKGCYDRFRTQARISGKGGHNLGKGWSFFYSTNNDSFALKAKCFIRQTLRWLTPFWRC